MYPSERLDLAAVTLLSDLPAWRLRAVERIRLSSALWSERDREIHVRPLMSALAERKVLKGRTKQVRALKSTLKAPPAWNVSGEGDSATLILPITDMPRIPLLDLHITVAGQDVYRIPLDESARIQAKYLSYLARCAKLTNRMHQLSPSLIDLLTAIFYFPSDPFEEIAKDRDRADAQYDYLMERREDFPFEGMDDAYPQWKLIADKISALATRYVLPDYVSSSEHPLIALPYFCRELKIRSEKRYGALKLEVVTGLLDELYSLLEKASDPPAGASREEEGALDRFASTYFGYGLRWMAFARCTVPLNEPFTITVRQKRAVYFSKTRDVRPPIKSFLDKTAWTTISFADAETNHVSIRVSDPAVRLLTNPEVEDEKGVSLAGERIDEEAKTFELYLRQSSTRGRKERILIGTHLRLTRLHSSMLWLAILITGFGLGLLAWRGVVEFRTPSTSGRTHGLSAKDAAVILVPATFAASLLLSRDSSTLSARIKQARQAVLTVELFLLLAMAFFLFLLHYIRPE
ncbi:hypothetical protein ACFVZW_02945 [Streptomyces sp. NPDC059567]|uniref:hypothetical protein n=1 Tax=Streptomyces sp. NPDC059567 TaxID=3346867 RepID=UPI0036CBF99D